MKRNAWTLVELLAVVALCGVLLALLLPAVQAARETARQTQCVTNIRQLAVAMHGYESAFRVLPATASNNYSFHVALLPYLEQQQLFNEFPLKLNAMDYQGPLLYRRISVFECPSDDSRIQAASLLALTNYHGNWGTGSERYGNNGIFSYLHTQPGFVRYLPLAAVSDGLSNTALLAEVLAYDKSSHPLRHFWGLPDMGPDLFEQFAQACRTAPARGGELKRPQMPRGRPWLECGMNWNIYNHILTPNQPSCRNGRSFNAGALTSTSGHPGKVAVAMVDGSVASTHNAIDLTVWRAIGSRAGNP